MVFVDTTGLVLFALLFLGLYNGYKTRKIQNKQLKELEIEIKNGATKIDMSKYQFLDTKMVEQKLGHLADFRVV